MPNRSTAVLLFALLLTFPSLAEIHFLTIGGGPDIFRNQIFFEKIFPSSARRSKT